MPVRRAEVFAEGPATPADVWYAVRDPRRWPEWTDAREVLQVEPDPLAEDGLVVVRDADTTRHWRVVTLGDGGPVGMVLEVVTRLERSRLGLGVRVRAAPVGVQVAMALIHSTEDRRASAAYLLGGRTRLLARLDRWTQRAAALRRPTI